MSSSKQIQVLLEKTSNYDKDERYMATSDLCTALQNDVKMDTNLERRICTAVLKQLDDTSNDVQAVAVKCLSILVKKVEEAQVSDICSKLCNLILTGKTELRDIYSIGLKTALEDLPEKMGPAIATQLTPRLLGGIKADGDENIKLETLDILTDLIKFYGQSMSVEHGNISTTALQQLSYPKPVIRKRATACLGRLATVVSDELLDRIVKTLLEQIEKPWEGTDKRTVIQTIGSISRMVGFRLGSHLGRIIPLFLTSLGKPEDDAMHNEGADELRENILHALESFVMRCPHEATAHVEAITTAMLAFLQFDPNYNYCDGDDMEEDEEDEDFDDFEDGEYSDEDDTSWKVRRASIKVLRATIVSRPEMLGEMYKSCASLLLDRFKERDDNVKLDIIDCYSELVRCIGGGASAAQDAARGAGDNKLGSALAGSESAAAALEQLKSDVPTIVRVSCRILRDKKAVKPKTGVFKLLQEVMRVLDGGLGEHLDALTPFVLDACKLDRDSSLVLEALRFIRTMLTRHPAAQGQAHVPQLSPAVLVCVSADWYKIVAEALRVVTVIVTVLRPATAAGTAGGDVDMVDAATGDFDFAPFVQPCFQAVLPRLQTHDIDMEIKESAIDAMGAILAVLGDHLTNELDQVLELLQERLGNEITRLSALKCIEQIAGSPLKLDLTRVVVRVVRDLVQFLRQQSRTLKQHTLVTLDELVKSGGSAMDAELFASIVDSSAKLIDGSDLYLSRMSVDLSVSVLEASGGQAVSAIQETVVPRVMKLITSSLLNEGSALVALRGLFRALVCLNAPPLDFDQVLALLAQPIQAPGAKLSKAAVEATSKCVAAAVVACPDPAKRDATLKKLLTDVQNGLSGQSDPLPVQLAVLCVGEVGRTIDLSTVVPEAHRVVLACLDSKELSEDIKSAAACTLGNITVGNMAGYLPDLMRTLEERTEQAQQYLLLSSLREVIVQHSAVKRGELQTDSILPVLDRHCESEEEGVRNMVAECLGKLAVIEPAKIVPYIAKIASTSDLPLVRWTLVTSLKYASASAAPAEALVSNIEPFIALLGDDDLAVRRAAIIAFNSIAHHRPSIIRSRAREEIVPTLFKETAVNDALKRTVNLGPFKHTVDDGLPLRKASFSCILTMLETMPDVMPIIDLLPHLNKGLKDVDDIAMLGHQIVAQIAAWSPHVLLSDIRSVLDPITVTINRNQASQAKQSVNTADDVIRSALRALDAIAAIPESKHNQSVVEVVNDVQSKEQCLALAEADHLQIGKRSHFRQ